MLRFLKLSLVLIFSLCLLELLLQLSRQNTEFSSFDVFVSHLKKHGVPSADLYFVGDSTIFGSGSSDSLRYSLPAQLQALLREVRPDFKVVNLGYAATCTEEHLQVLELLPSGAYVAYRGGVSDMWNKGGGFRIVLGSVAFELRILKMLSMLLGSFLPNVAHRQENIRSQIKRLIQRKNLRLLAIDYSIGPHFQSFYCYEPIFTIVPLRYMLEEAGFRQGGNLEDRFISMNTRSHPNDLGYFLEALGVFNFFCAEGLFGLSEQNKLSWQLLASFSKNLTVRYEEMKRRLKLVDEREFITEKARINEFILEFFSLVSLLKYQDLPEKEQLSQEADKLSRLLLLFFHEPSQIASFLMSSHNIYSPDEADIIPDLQKIELYYAVLIATAGKEQQQWHYVYERVRNSRFPLTLRSVSYLPQISPFPLEFCDRFLQESGYSAAELSIRADWEYFFTIPFAALQNWSRPVCRYEQ